MKTSRGFVLRAFKHGESDLIIRLLDREGSRITLAARGALRSKKRFGGGVLEPTHFIEAVYASGRGESEVGVLQEAKLVNDFAGIRKDYERLQLALHFVALVDKIGRESTPDSEHLFDLLGHALRSCEVARDLNRLRLHFEVKLLAYQGVLPHDFVHGSKLAELPLRQSDELPIPNEDLGLLLKQSDQMVQAYLGR